MANHITDILAEWIDRRDETEWVLGTVIEISGSSYRKPGAMMLINGLGQSFGLISGGCLESNLSQYASEVMQAKKALTVTYDMSDEDNIAWQLGIGCGGTIRIQLNLIAKDNRYLRLDDLYKYLKNRNSGFYILPLTNEAEPELIPDQGASKPEYKGYSFPDNLEHVAILGDKNNAFLLVPFKPKVHLLLFGGGVDARPVANIASELGWDITLVDHRPSYAREAYFKCVSKIARCLPEELIRQDLIDKIDCAIIMTHNIDMDANALMVSSRSSARYIALLGPEHRREQVLEKSRIHENDIAQMLSGPAGLDLGGEVPESIALSILAECHAALEGRDARPLRRWG